MLQMTTDCCLRLAVSQGVRQLSSRGERVCTPTAVAGSTSRVPKTRGPYQRTVTSNHADYNVYLLIATGDAAYP